MSERPAEFGIVRLRETAAVRPLVARPREVVRYWHTQVATGPGHNGEVETLVAMLVDTKLRIIGHHVVAVGTLNEVMSHPRECFRAAIIAAAYGLLLAHNHPSGCAAPSGADVAVTKRMIRAGKVVGIPLVDHVVVGRRGARVPFFSFREDGRLFKVDRRRVGRTGAGVS